MPPIFPTADVASIMRQVKLIVPFPAGGSTAYTAKVLAEALEREFAIAAAFDYRIGDYGLNALRALVHAEEETVLMVGNIITASMTPVFRHDSLNFDFATEVVPVTKLAEFPSVLMIPLSMRIDEVDALLKFCKRRDGVLRYGSDFLGTFVDVDALELARQAGVTAALHEAGSANGVLAALMAGDIDMALLNVATAAANRGQYKPLAISGPRRLTGFPDIPTLAETGYKGIGTLQWQGLFASRRLRPELLEGLHGAVTQAMHTAAARLAMEAIDATAITSASPALFGAEIGAEMARWESMRAQILALRIVGNSGSDVRF
jgi:tripartite-type tricarboxylate transporter receptor subunit TctC